MSWGGSVSAMISSIKMNRALGKKSKPMKERMEPYKTVYNKKALRYRNSMSIEEYKIFKEKLIQKRKRGRNQLIAVVSILVVLSVVSILWASSI